MIGHDTHLIAIYRSVHGFVLLVMVLEKKLNTVVAVHARKEHCVECNAPGDLGVRIVLLPEMNVASGCLRLVLLLMIHDPAYVFNNTMYVKLIFEKIALSVALGVLECYNAMFSDFLSLYPMTICWLLRIRDCSCFHVQRLKILFCPSDWKVM